MLLERFIAKKSMEEYINQDEVGEEIDLDDDADGQIVDDEDEVEENTTAENGQAATGDTAADTETLEADAEDVGPLDEADTTFSQHKEAVLTVKISPSSSFVVSGGQDDSVYVWNPSDGSIIHTCTGHTDSVDTVGISVDESLIAAADMGGLIQVWKNELNTEKSEKFKLIFDYQVDDINWLRFHPVANSVILVGTAVGTVWMFNALDSSKVKTFQGTNISCTCGQLSPDGTLLVAGYIDGSIRIWDIKSGSVIHCIKDKAAHSSNINWIDVKKDLAATASTDGTIKLINLTNGKVLATMLAGKQSSSSKDDESEEEADSVETVAFSASSVLSVLASVTVSGCVDIWDLSSLQKRLSFSHQGGASKLLWDPIEPHKLIIGGLDGMMRVWDARDGRLLSSRRAHYDSVLDFALASSGFLVTASEDMTCKVFLN